MGSVDTLPDGQVIQTPGNVYSPLEIKPTTTYPSRHWVIFAYVHDVAFTPEDMYIPVAGVVHWVVGHTVVFPMPFPE